MQAKKNLIKEEKEKEKENKKDVNPQTITIFVYGKLYFRIAMRLTWQRLIIKRFLATSLDKLSFVTSSYTAKTRLTACCLWFMMPSI